MFSLQKSPWREWCFALTRNPRETRTRIGVDTCRGERLETFSNHQISHQILYFSFTKVSSHFKSEHFCHVFSKFSQLGWVIKQPPPQVEAMFLGSYNPRPTCHTIVKIKAWHERLPCIFSCAKRISCKIHDANAHTRKRRVQRSPNLHARKLD